MQKKLFDALEKCISSLIDKTDPVNNLLRLLRQPIFNQIGLVAFYLQYNKGKVISTNESVYDLDLWLAVTKNGCC